MIWPITALMLATIFASIALYISLVEHPARLLLDDAAMVAQWRPSYARAFTIQASLAALGSLACLLAFFATHHPAWTVAALLLVANWPFTLLIILPLNRRLQAPDAADGCRPLMQRWGRLHAVRSALGTVAVIACLYAMLG